MRTFTHFNPRTIDEAVAILQRYGNKARVLAGGTDILGKMKDEILPTYPEALVNIKTVTDLDFIEAGSGLARIGALTRLDDIARNDVIKERFPALAEAAGRTASPHLRAMGTIGGNICQDIRCWYYRNANNRFPCMRKGGRQVLCDRRGQPLSLHIRRQRRGRLLCRAPERYGPGPRGPSGGCAHHEKNGAHGRFLQCQRAQDHRARP